MFKLNRKQKKAVAEKKAIDKAKSKNPAKYNEFVRLGGANSGVFDISDTTVAKFVNQYHEFIPKSEICKRDKKGNLLPVYKS